MIGTASERTVPPPAEVRPARGLWHAIGVALSGALLLLVIALAVLLIVVPKATGGQPLTVLTSSMEPGLPPGTLIVVRPVDPGDLRIGDVVTYQIRSGQPGVITHRVIAIASASTGARAFTLKGDNNSDPDAEQVREEQVQGRLWYSVPLIGYLNNVIGGANRAWVVPGAAVLLLAYSGFMIAAGVVGEVRKRRRPGRSF